jgi:hypothetical protein
VTRVDLGDLKRNPAHMLLLLKDCGVVQFGGGWRARCPVHGGEKLSFSFGRGRSGVMAFNCFACGAKGNAIDLVQLLDNCDFKTAIARMSGTEHVERVSRWAPSLGRKRGPKRTRMETSIPCEEEGCPAVLRILTDDLVCLAESHPGWDFDIHGLLQAWAWCPTHHRSARTGRVAGEDTSACCEAAQPLKNPSGSDPSLEPAVLPMKRFASGPEPTVVGPQTRGAP